MTSLLFDRPFDQNRTASYLRKVRQDFSNASCFYADYAQMQHQNYESLSDFVIFCLQRPIVSLHHKCSVLEKSDAIALDIGSGSGVGLVFFQKKHPNFQWCALDLSEQMLANHENVNFKIVADMSYLPVASQSISLVISNFALHWSLDIALTLREIARVLTVSGVAAFSFPVQGSFHILADIWRAHGLESPLHAMPALEVIDQFLQEQEKAGRQVFSRVRLLSLPFVSGFACFEWLKKTGVRQKVRSKKRMTKSQYKSILSMLTVRLHAGDVLRFKMIDVVIQ